MSLDPPAHGSQTSQSESGNGRRDKEHFRRGMIEGNDNDRTRAGTSRLPDAPVVAMAVVLALPGAAVRARYLLTRRIAKLEGAWQRAKGKEQKAESLGSRAKEIGCLLFSLSFALCSLLSGLCNPPAC